MIDADNRRNSEFLDVLDMPAEIRASLLHCPNIFRAEIGLRDAAVHLHGSYGRDDHNRFRREARFPAFDVEKLFRSKIGAEARLGDDVIGEL